MISRREGTCIFRSRSDFGGTSPRFSWYIFYLFLCGRHKITGLDLTLRAGSSKKATTKPHHRPSLSAALRSIMTAFPPHDIASLALNSDGWIIPPSINDDGTVHHHDDVSNREGCGGDIVLTPSCKTLLTKLKLDVSSSVFSGNTIEKGDKSGGEWEGSYRIAFHTSTG